MCQKKRGETERTHLTWIKTLDSHLLWSEDWGSFICSPSSRREKGSCTMSSRNNSLVQGEKKKQPNLTTNPKIGECVYVDVPAVTLWKQQRRLAGCALSLQKSEIEIEASGSSHSCMHGYTFFIPPFTAIGMLLEKSTVRCTQSNNNTHMERSVKERAEREKWYCFGSTSKPQSN